MLIPDIVNSCITQYHNPLLLREQRKRHKLRDKLYITIRRLRMKAAENSSSSSSLFRVSAGSIEISGAVGSGVASSGAPAESVPLLGDALVPKDDEED